MGPNHIGFNSIGTFPPGFASEYPHYAEFCRYVEGNFGSSTQWNWQLFDTLYRTSWVAERCVTALSDDICDKWRVFEHDDPEVLKIRQAYEEENEISSIFLDYINQGRLYGGSALVPILKHQFDEESFKKPFDLESIQKDDLIGFQVLNRFDFAPEIGINRDIFINPRLFGDFIYYKIIRIQTMSMSKSDYITKEPVSSINLPTIHSSRMIKYGGKKLFYYQRFFSGGWDDSILVPIINKIPAIEEAFWLLYFYLDSFNIDEYGVPNLTAIMSASTSSPLFQKFIQFRDKMRNAKLRMKDLNDTLNRNQLGSIQNIVPVFQALLQFCVGSTGIPITRMLGTSVGGWSTGDNELTQYYDLVGQSQNKLSPQLKIADEIIERSLFGKKMDIKYRWLPKRELTEKERSEINQNKANTFQIYMQNRVMTPQVVAQNIQNDFDGFDENYILSLDEDFLDYETMEGDDLKTDDDEKRESGETEKSSKEKDQESEGSDLEIPSTDSED